MKLPRQTARREVGANMTPMIDVVFLLIIFFLVSSHLARQESRLPLDLPSAAIRLMDDPERRALTINVDPQSRIVVRGQELDVVSLRRILMDFASEEGTDASLRIRTHKFAAYRVVEPILRTAALVGITDISLSVQSKADGA